MTRSWARTAEGGYEVSSAGDARFSALTARLRDGRTIEEAYQLDVKGYRAFSDNWRAGKGKPPLSRMSEDALYAAYRALWSRWAGENRALMEELRRLTKDGVLTDKFANTPVSQARALCEILNETEEEDF